MLIGPNQHVPEIFRAHKIAFILFTLVTLFASFGRSVPTDFVKTKVSMKEAGSPTAKVVAVNMDGKWTGTLDNPHDGRPYEFKMKITGKKAKSEIRDVTVDEEMVGKLTAAYEGVIVLENERYSFEEEKKDAKSTLSSSYRKRLVFTSISDKEMKGNWYDADSDEDLIRGTFSLRKE